MEGFSLTTAFFLSSTIAGIVGNRSDAVLWNSIKIITNRLREGDASVNHDIQRAVYKSQLQATLVAIEAYLKELGAEPTFLRKIGQALITPDTDVTWLGKARDHLRRELKKVKKPNTLPPATSADEDIELLLQPKGLSAEERIGELRTALVETVLFELRLLLPGIPGRFEEIMRKGWDEQNPSGGTTHLDWFDALSLFFQNELKHNQALANIFQSQILANLRVDNLPVTLQNFQAQLRSFSQDFTERLTLLENHLDNMRSQQLEGFAGLEERFDELLPMLLLLPTIADQQKMLHKVLQDEGELTRRHISEKLEDVKESNARLEEAINKRTDASTERIEEINRKLDLLRDGIRLSGKSDSTRHPIPIPLPTLRGTFVDRESEQNTLRRLLRDSDMRLVIIVAPGGYGKTELTTKILQDMTTESNITDGDVKGILYLRCLRGDLSLERVFTQAGRIVGKGEEFQQMYASRDWSLERKLEFFFHELTLAGNIWLVLDNFEDLLADDDTIEDPELGQFVQSAFVTQHSVRLIATTRAVPRFEGSHRLQPISLHHGLPEDQAIAYLRTEGANYGLQTEKEELLRSFVRRVYYIPKALESIIGYLAEHPFVTLASLMEKDELFADFDRYDAEKGLKRLIAEQFNDLSADDQLVLCTLSVFSAFIPLDAISYLLPAQDLSLARLLGNRLIETQSGLHGTLYGLHPLVREYAYERIPDVHTEGTRFTKPSLHANAASFFRRLRLEASQWRTPADLSPQINEFEHLVKAHDYDNAGRLLNEIDNDYLFLWGEARRVLLMSEQLLGHLTDKFLAGANLCRLGIACWNLGLYRRATDYLNQALIVVQETGDTRIESMALGSLGISHYYLGAYEQAIQYCHEAVKKAQEHGYREQESEQLRFLGNAHSALGEYTAAIEYYRKAFAVATKLSESKDRRGEDYALGALGKVSMHIGQYAKAVEYLQQAVEIARNIKHRRGECFHLSNLGLAYRDRGQYEQAISHYDEALTMARDIGERHVEGYCLGGIGKTHLYLREFDTALEKLLQALKITTAMNMTGSRQHWATTTAQAYLHKNDLPQALSIIQSISEDDTVWNNYRTAMLHGLILMRCDQREAARDVLRKAISEADKVLRMSEDYYDAKYIRGLSLSGLALLTQEPECSLLLKQAQDAYSNAHTNCSEPGVVTNAQLLFDELAILDSEDILTSINSMIDLWN